MQTQINNNSKKSKSCRRPLVLAAALSFMVPYLAVFQTASVASAGSWVEKSKIVPTWKLHPDIHLGNAVDLSSDGTKAIVGGHTGSGGYGLGRAVLLSKASTGSWGQHTKLGDTEFANSEFGSSLGISELGYAVIGAPYYFPNVGDYGKVHFWQNTVSHFWEETDNFWFCCSGLGKAVAISGGLAVLGYPDYLGKGLVETYEQSGDGDWHRVNAILPSDLSAGDGFGSSVAITKSSGYYFLAIGAPSQGANAGAVYVYRKSSVGAGNWTLEQKIAITYSCMLGGSVSISGDLLAIGEDTGAGGQNGRVVILKRPSSGAWYIEAGFLIDSAGNSTSARANSVLGGPVAIAGSFAAFGAPESGKVFTFFRNAYGWSKLGSLSGKIGSRFGAALDLADDGQLIVGAPNEDTLVDFDLGGAAYIYKWQ